MPVSSLIFDLDGTLIDSVGVVGAILNEMRAERQLPPLDHDFYRHWSSRGGLHLVGHALAVMPQEAQELLDAFRRRYRALPTPLESVYPHTHSTLTALRDAGFRLALCSNKPEHLCHKVLTETGLGSYFTSIIGGDSTPHAKPHPAPLKAACDALNTDPRLAVFIGDSTVDQKTALACGVPFIFFASGYDDGVTPSATAGIIRSLSELQDALLLLAERDAPEMMAS